jgi:hypothetical protein
MTPKEQYYKYGESLGISINDLQRLKMLADNCQEDMATTKEFMSKETLDKLFDLHDDDDFIDGDSDNSKVTRFEVIDENGRVYTKHNYNRTILSR